METTTLYSNCPAKIQIPSCHHSAIIPSSVKGRTRHDGTHACNPSIWETETGRLSDPRLAQATHQAQISTAGLWNQALLCSNCEKFWLP